MYTVYCDGALVYAPNVPELKITDPKLHLEAGMAGSFDFTIYPSHPMYAQIARLSSTIEVYQDKAVLFRGRVLNDKSGFRNERNITCEGELAYFNDSIYRPYSYAGSVKGFLQAIIDSHNAQVEPKKQFVMGNVTVTDPNDYIVRSSINADKSWNVMQDKLVKMLGGYFMIRRVEGINYLDYLEDASYMSQQEIKLGENLLDLQKDIKGESIVTALIPYGAKLEDAEGNEIDERVTIEPANDGVDYVYNQDAVDAYGWVFDTVTYEDITQPQNLLTRASTELAQRILTDITIDVSAVDLSMTDAEIDKLRIFEYVKVDSPIHLLDDYMLITKLDIDLFNPQNNKLSLGINYKTFVERQLQTNAAIKDIQTLAPGEIRQTLSDAVTQVATVLQSSVEQTSDAIRREVSETYTTKSELGEYQSEVNTQFEQSSDAFNYNFNDLKQKITEVDGETRTEFKNIQKYIRFENGRIILGEVDNPFILEIRNDRICFLQDGVEVAYLSNEGDTQQLYINEGYIIKSLRIGNFAFEPRQNGNLSLTKVM